MFFFVSFQLINARSTCTAKIDLRTKTCLLTITLEKDRQYYALSTVSALTNILGRPDSQFAFQHFSFLTGPGISAAWLCCLGWACSLTCALPGRRCRKSSCFSRTCQTSKQHNCKHPDRRLKFCKTKHARRTDERARGGIHACFVPCPSFRFLHPSLFCRALLQLAHTQ